MSAEKKKPVLPRADIEKFREILLDRRKEVGGDVAQLQNQAVRSYEDEVSVDHMADHGSDSYEKDQTIGFIEREGASLRAIDLALQKIKDGSFGICEGCSGRIRKVRLNAIPYARLCLKCQIAEEKA
jgi:DnaK suppressor protein